MRMVVRLLAISATTLLALAGPAHAGGAAIARGGPSGKARTQLVRALDGLRSSALAVCWRGDVNKVKVELFVAASGVVARAVHRSGDAVGQCAAGVLAVQRLPKAGKSYRALVVLDARSSARAGGRTSAMITEDLVSYRPALQRCYDQSGIKKSGPIAVRFVIQPDGRIVDPRVEQAFAPAVDACVVRALQRARLRAVSGGKAVSYALTMQLSPGGGTAAAVGSAGAGAPQPKKHGPIPASVLSDVMKQAMPTFQACARQAKGKELAGTAVVRFTIRADGTTRNVKIKKSDLGAPRVERCLVKTAGKLRFPAEKGRAKTRVFYPFRFQ
jgi:TonB family protein